MDQVRLENYVRRKGLTEYPKYEYQTKGPPNGLVFRCRITVDHRVFDTMEWYSNKKKATAAASHRAIVSLSPEVADYDLHLCKNMLAEYANNKSFHAPEYMTKEVGKSFISQVTINNQIFKGEEAKRKNRAEMMAALAAYLHFTKADKEEAEKERARFCMEICLAE